MINKFLKFTFLFLIFQLSLSCSNSKENKELNKIIKPIVNNERRFNPSLIYISDSLKQLKVYVPSKDEVEQKPPPPPPSKTTSIDRLLAFKKNYTKMDSIKILNQNNYKLKRIDIDKSINVNLQIINSINKKKTAIYLSFSTPIYFDNNSVYIEVYGSAKGIGYLLNKKKDTWKIVNQKLLWIH
ncbi:hypothetical protein [Epilithonimonas sp.]|uniref:hypothetical protein n=1 Tax=Epilithonimonas sp. TaxID=2894511 RepID=UPI0028974073|nr:hypothetical protein [Epilithonimonas sp.]